MIIDNAFDARFYAPWLALTVWFCYLQMLAGDDEPTARRIARCALAILAATIHYFGAFAIMMIAATDFYIHRQIKRIIPPILGVLALAACVPFALGQRAGLTLFTWIDPATAADIKEDAVALFGAPSILAVLLVMWIARLLRGKDVAMTPPHRSFRELLPMSSLLLFPAVIVAFSVLVQPALVLRYLILAIVPLAPMLAALIERSGRTAITVTIVLLLNRGARISNI